MMLQLFTSVYAAVRPGATTETGPARAPSQHACRRLSTFLLCAVLAGLAWHLLGPGWMPQPGVGDGGVLSLVLLCGLYALVLALPFVPAIEIGLLVMLLFGKMGAVIAWGATLVGLNIAFAVGRYLGDCAGSDRRMRLPPKLARWMDHLATTRWRALVPVLTLAALLNMPGNTAIGGGGGIAMLYGATRMLSWPAFALTVALATSMLPVLFVLGLVSLEPLMDTVMAGTTETGAAR